MKLTIYLTYVCDCICSYCNIKKDNICFEYDDYVNILSLYPNITEVSFLGGEPTLHPKFLSFLKYNREHNHKNILITNASNISDIEYINYCDELIVSLDGTEEYNSNVRHYQNFDNALHFIKVCKENNKKISINKVVTYNELLNEHILYSNIEFLKTLSVPTQYILVNDIQYDINIIETFKKYMYLFNTYNKLCDKNKNDKYIIKYDFRLCSWIMTKCMFNDSSYNKDCDKCVYNTMCLSCPKHDVFESDLSCFRCLITKR